VCSVPKIRPESLARPPDTSDVALGLPRMELAIAHSRFFHRFPHC
jgi:hypothetical protein